MIKAAIVGGSGYVGGEVLRLLLGRGSFLSRSRTLKCVYLTVVSYRRENRGRICSINSHILTYELYR